MPSNPLHFLEENISRPGGVPFEQFMSLALFAPEHGYYSAKVDAIGGERGDFATSPSVTNAFGIAIAEWYLENEQRGLFSNALKSVEIGGGSGALSRAFLNHLSLGKRLLHRHGMVETSPLLRAYQKSAFPRWSRVRWSETCFSSPPDSRPLILFSNELVDAFPVILLQWNRRTGSWDEVFIEFDRRRGLLETFRPLTESRPTLDQSHFAHLRHFETRPPVDTQRIELHASYREWLRETIRGIPTGSHLLTIDYGSENTAEMYDKRPGGSLRAYHKRQRLTGAAVYRLFGRQDLTADVNFTDLREWGETLGLETLRHESQSTFLRRYLHDKPSILEQRETQHLLSEDGAGTAFRVLHQRKIRHETDV